VSEFWRRNWPVVAGAAIGTLIGDWLQYVQIVTGGDSKDPATRAKWRAAARRQMEIEDMARKSLIRLYGRRVVHHQ
jgi:hypothetical protein